MRLNWGKPAQFVTKLAVGFAGLPAKTQMARGGCPTGQSAKSVWGRLRVARAIRSRRGRVWGADCVLYAQSLRGSTSLFLRRASTARLTLRSHGICTAPLLVASMTDCTQRRCDFLRFSKTLLPLPPCVFYAVCELKIATHWGRVGTGIRNFIKVLRNCSQQPCGCGKSLFYGMLTNSRTVCCAFGNARCLICATLQARRATGLGRLQTDR